MLQQETLKSFPILLVFESEKDCQQGSSLNKIHLEELQNKMAVIFPSHLTQEWGGPFSNPRISFFFACEVKQKWKQHISH